MMLKSDGTPSTDGRILRLGSAAGVLGLAVQFVVSTLHPGPFPDDSRAFWREVGQYYEIETTIGGVPIYRAKDAT